MNAGSTVAPGAAAYLAAVAAVLMWGATPAITAIAIREVDPVEVGMLRTIVAAAVLLPVARLLRHPLPARREDWVAMGVVALGGLVGFNLLFTVGLQHTSTAHAALIIGGAPILTGLIGFVLDRAWPRRIWWAGAGIAFTGEALLVSGRFAGADAGDATLRGDLLVVGATLCASAGYVAGGRLSARIGTWSVTAWSPVLASVLLVPVMLLRWPQTDWGAVTSSGFAAVLYLAVFASILGYAAWYWAIARAGVGRVAPVQFSQPLVSLVIAVVVLGEALTPTVLLATTTILLGIAVCRLR